MPEFNWDTEKLYQRRYQSALLLLLDVVRDAIQNLGEASDDVDDEDNDCGIIHVAAMDIAAIVHQRIKRKNHNKQG